MDGQIQATVVLLAIANPRAAAPIFLGPSERLERIHALLRHRVRRSR